MLVKFGNNWIKKIPRTAKLDSAYGLVLGIFLIQLFPNWTACSPITYTNRVCNPCGRKFLIFKKILLGVLCDLLKVISAKPVGERK